MLYYEDNKGMFHVWKGQPVKGEIHPLEIETLWPAEKLAAIGLFSPVVPVVPADKVVTSKSVARIGGVVSFTYNTETKLTDSEADIANLNSVLTSDGSVVRALGLIMFDEINKLRVKNGDTAYTMNQFKAALAAKMRT